MKQKKNRRPIPARRKHRIDKKTKQSRLVEIAFYSGYPAPVYWNDRYWRRLHSYGTRYSARYYRKYCNRKVRRTRGKIGNGGNYRKWAEFWHEIW